MRKTKKVALVFPANHGNITCPSHGPNQPTLLAWGHAVCRQCFCWAYTEAGKITWQNKWETAFEIYQDLQAQKENPLG